MTAVVAVMPCTQRMLLRKLFHTIFERIVSAIPFFSKAKASDTVLLLFWERRKKKKNKESPFIVFFEIVIQLFLDSELVLV